MPPWLQSLAPTSESGANPLLLAVRLVLALALGLVVAAIYRRTNGGDVVPSFRATLVLLTVLIAAVTQVIGDNVARAFSLVGALSIVRFRTVVRDTRDTAFVIFAVTVGMAVGAGDLWVAGLSLAIVGVAAAIVSRPVKQVEIDANGYHLSVTVPLSHRVDEVVAPIFQQHIARHTILEVSTASRGAALETKYEVWLAPDTDPATLIAALNEVEGVQSAQLRRIPEP